MIQDEEKVLDDLRNLYRSIKQSMENKEYSKAEKAISEGVAIVKDKPENMFFSYMYKFLCKLKIIKNEYLEAIAGAETFLKNKKNPSIIDLDFYIMLGEAYENLDDYEEAFKAYSEYLSAYKRYKEDKLEKNISIVDSADSITICQYNFILLTIANCAFMKGDIESSTSFLKNVDFEPIDMELLSSFVISRFSQAKSNENFDFIYMLYEKFEGLESSNYLFAFINLAEKNLRENPKSMISYTQSFEDSKLRNEYVRLQKLRYLDINGEKDKALELYDIFMNEMEIYAYPYNDLLYYAVKYNKDLEVFYECMEFNDIGAACLDLAFKHEAFSETLLEYLGNNKSKGTGIKTAFMLSLLLEGGLSIANADKDHIESMFAYFIETTSICIEQLFQKSILNDENCFLLPRGYRFAYYMGKAFEKKDKKEIFENYLLKAQECYPTMEKALLKIK